MENEKIKNYAINKWFNNLPERYKIIVSVIVSIFFFAVVPYVPLYFFSFAKKDSSIQIDNSNSKNSSPMINSPNGSQNNYYTTIHQSKIPVIINHEPISINELIPNGKYKQTIKICLSDVDKDSKLSILVDNIKVEDFNYITDQQYVPGCGNMNGISFIYRIYFITSYKIRYEDIAVI